MYLTCELTSHLGFIINYDKSMFSPSQLLTYLRAVLNLNIGVASPTQEWTDNLIDCATLLALLDSAYAKAWLHLLSLMASLVNLIQFCRLQMRPVQLHLLSFFQLKYTPLTGRFP